VLSPAGAPGGLGLGSPTHPTTHPSTPPPRPATTPAPLPQVVSIGPQLGQPDCSRTSADEIRLYISPETAGRLRTVIIGANIYTPVVGTDPATYVALPTAQVFQRPGVAAQVRGVGRGGGGGGRLRHSGRGAGGWGGDTRVGAAGGCGWGDARSRK
jgi:hypothetical protein